ncbi:FecCD family ABC transporter permease [Afipia carboxidovorans]|uniref:FecCD family ABC transporter permease n=1 Tax=Afipia carboxidovorans TaxID=40137 RepID=UPI003089D39C|nr:iron ABC transporter permease [Afipia carboxidovorans]
MSALTTRGSGKSFLRRPPAVPTLLALFSLLALALVVSATVGAANIPLHRLWPALGIGTPDGALIDRDQLVLYSIRLPRLVCAAMIGALLAMAGALMQGLFRNALADPALVGVSSGGAFAAALTIVISDTLLAGHAYFGLDMLPFAAFVGSLITTFALYRIASSSGRTSVAVFLLAGLAIAALANAGIGLLVFIADDRQLRDITFWLLGSLSGATWAKAAMLVPALVAMLIALPLLARPLDLLVLGEAEAFHAGVAVERTKRIAIVLVSAMTGVSVAVCGIVGFVGIIVPHLLRISIGPGHRLLLPASALLGAVLMVTADSCARIIAAPAEVPIGILTAAVGAPFFLILLLRQRALVGL